MDNSFIKLYRKIQDNWIWDNPLYLKCWIDMLMRANIKSSSTLINEHIVEVSRGEIVFSQRNFAKRNKMSRQQLRTFLKKLEKSKMIRVKSNPLLTHLILVGYSTYNDSKLTQGQPKVNPRLRDRMGSPRGQGVTRNIRNYHMFPHARRQQGSADSGHRIPWK